MQFQARSEVLTGPELLELAAIGPDELAMKAVSSRSGRERPRTGIAGVGKRPERTLRDL